MEKKIAGKTNLKKTGTGYISWYFGLMFFNGAIRLPSTYSAELIV